MSPAIHRSHRGLYSLHRQITCLCFINGSMRSWHAFVWVSIVEEIKLHTEIEWFEESLGKRTIYKGVDWVRRPCCAPGLIKVESHFWECMRKGMFSTLQKAVWKLPSDKSSDLLSKEGRTPLGDLGDECASLSLSSFCCQPQADLSWKPVGRALFFVQIRVQCGLRWWVGKHLCALWVIWSA
jgi:hypothetical protein